MDVRGAATAALWVASIFLVLLSGLAAGGRTIAVSDAAVRAEPLRRTLLTPLWRRAPDPVQSASQAHAFDRNFATHPLLARLHVVPGFVFLALALLQLSPWVRNRSIALHRWTGRALLAVGFIAIAPALFFGLLMPYAGPAEATAIALFGGLFGVALSRAYFAVRAGDIARHREWMIRAFAVALAISTIRMFSILFDVLLTPAGWTTRGVFVTSVWTGWPATVAVTEIWIRATRAAAVPLVEKT